MSIHSATKPSHEETDTDCKIPPLQTIRQFSRRLFLLLDFYNYFQHGLDFLISGSTHIVKKIVLHSNVVSDSFVRITSNLVCKAGSPLFQRYKRCNWEIEGKPEDDEDGKCMDLFIVEPLIYLL